MDSDSRTIGQMWNRAVDHHRAGRFDQAARAYREITDRMPDHADALHMQGLIALQTGRFDEAIDWISRAIAVNRRVASYHSNLASAMVIAGRPQEAIAACERALQLQPNYPEAHYNTGAALQKLGRLEPAVAAYRRAIAERPNYSQAFNSLGTALQQAGKLDEAIAAYRQAIALDPSDSRPCNNLGNALTAAGRLEEAVASYRQALTAHPDDPEVLTNLGLAVGRTGRLDEAGALHRRAIALRPNLAAAHNNLGTVLRLKRQYTRAIEALRTALTIQPDFLEARLNLGVALHEGGRLDEAIDACRQVLEARPDSADAMTNLAHVLKDTGRLDEAIELWRKASVVGPSMQAMQNLLMCVHYHPAWEPRDVLAEHVRWNSTLPRPAIIRPHDNDPDPERRLRVGFVSPDLRHHVVGHNIRPLFENRDRDHFEYFCYSNVIAPDDLTERFRVLSDGWREIWPLNDDQAAERIRADRIDVLIDLTMHMGDSRLLILTRRPAPVQAVFAAYPSTAGLAEAEYRLTDPWLDPPGQNDALYREKSIRLRDSFWCWEPIDSSVPVNEPPSAAAGHVTFGCLNYFCKVNEPTLSRWAAVMRAVPHSRLILMARPGSSRSWAAEVLAARGIEPERIEFVDLQPWASYMRTYHRIDIVLDTSPYNGHTTSLDALWMGVPVVSLIGPWAVGRAGVCQLHHVDLEDLAARDDEDFVRIAVDLAGDLPRRTRIRATLRERMTRSPLMDAPRFAQSVELAVREMWRIWCASREGRT